MRIRFKMTSRLLSEIMQDLVRPHIFAAERVGFVACRIGSLASSGIVVLAHSYLPVKDDDYVDLPGPAATMNSSAIRKALQFSYHNNAAMFHIHMHGHVGTPDFSHVDERECARFVPDFWNVQPEIPHGAIVLSSDSATGKCWYPRVPKPISIAEFVFVGSCVRCLWNV
jgi:hypothetical protein